MLSIASIIAIAVNKQVLPERICILIGCAFSESSLEVAEKGLGHSVVPTVAFSTHALHELLFCDDLPEIIAGLLHSLVTEAAALAGRLPAPAPKVPGTRPRCGAVGEGHDLAGPGGTAPSRASACSCAATRTIRPRRVRGHHWPWPRTGFP